MRKVIKRLLCNHVYFQIAKISATKIYDEYVIGRTFECSKCGERIHLTCYDKVDKPPVIEANWLRSGTLNSGYMWSCTHCHKRIFHIQKDKTPLDAGLNRCPHCRAYMKKVVQNELGTEDASKHKTGV